ncbi:MAG TPA: 2,3-bisphosphoglycerate-independent phosphoglycerate mutase [Thermoanaerobaculia bacterium]|jgi:2,3-bisphosphoglycerate-independent phosphoglycerate mutase|nr:2,3-bisphosphoglycerate-independent phosphoglycerate mutase [Thermoanaerobaculia bacterium]
MSDRPFLILIVIDGFGCRGESEFNAIAQAETPTFDRLFHDSSWTTLEASGLAVGLPRGQMGNSEVGHLNIGAGRIVDQDIVRISKAVSDHQLEANPTLVDAVAHGGAIHFAGLLSDGGVHSMQTHLHGLIDAAIALGARDIFVHAILDGRDTPPRSAEKYLGDLAAHIDGKPQVHIATVIGRYFTMDRDKRWDRVQRGYDLMTLGVGTETKDPLETLRRFYEQGVTDEFVEPISVLAADGAHRGRIEDGDALVFFNFRADRMRQIVSAFKDADFGGFHRAVRPKVHLATMNSYREDWTLPVLFPPQEVKNHLGEVLSHAGLKQLRIAETEKYAHVTFFFNGGSDTKSPGEERILVPSPKVATYDLKPEMSISELTDKVVEAIASKTFDVIIMNIANPDMVGHTGVMSAAVEAVHDTDGAIHRILAAVEKVDGVALITADHGNAELMFDPATGQPHTAHTTNPVPLILVDPHKRFGSLRGGGALQNVAPTILAILGIEQPKEMTGQSLLERSNA